MSIYDNASQNLTDRRSFSFQKRKKKLCCIFKIAEKKKNCSIDRSCARARARLLVHSPAPLHAHTDTWSIPDQISLICALGRVPHVRLTRSNALFFFFFIPTSFNNLQHLIPNSFFLYNSNVSILSVHIYKPIYIYMQISKWIYWTAFCPLPDTNLYCWTPVFYGDLCNNVTRRNKKISG